MTGLVVTTRYLFGSALCRCQPDVAPFSFIVDGALSVRLLCRSPHTALAGALTAGASLPHQSHTAMAMCGAFTAVPAYHSFTLLVWAWLLRGVRRQHICWLV